MTGRKAPSAINAIFNFRSFWDGRADNVFNGVNPNGPSDTSARVLKGVNGRPAWFRIAIPNASLASQAVGPPMSPVEMACEGRIFPQIGRKLLGLKPLALQTVHPNDSRLGSLSAFPDKGLTTTYAAMIRKAFRRGWWNSTLKVQGFTMMEHNFSLFFGLSVMLYEATLVSDDTPLTDSWQELELSAQVHKEEWPYSPVTAGVTSAILALNSPRHLSGLRPATLWQASSTSD